jgi:hypothetical protein
LLRVDEVNVLIVPPIQPVANLLLLILHEVEHLLAASELLLLLTGKLAATSVHLIKELLELLLVLCAELLSDDLHVFNWVNPVLNVDNSAVVEGAENVENPVDLLDVREEGVSEALAFRGALDQAGDIDHLEEGWHPALGLVQVAEIVVALVRKIDACCVGIDRA